MNCYNLMATSTAAFPTTTQDMIFWNWLIKMYSRELVIFFKESIAMMFQVTDGLILLSDLSALLRTGTLFSIHRGIQYISQRMEAVTHLNTSIQMTNENGDIEICHIFKEWRQ